jgi:hypothetical protein
MLQPLAYLQVFGVRFWTERTAATDLLTAPEFNPTIDQ